MTITSSCRYYRGSRPCDFNKSDGSECPTCSHARVFRDRILFVKLDAIGDVLRSASILPAIIARHDAPYVVWLTNPESVELVGMMPLVDEVIDVSAIGLARIQTGDWDQVYSLSNDEKSAAFATLAAGGREVIGYGLERGSIRPSGPAAREWLEMAAFDRLKKANARSYQRIMLDIVGHSGDFAPPVLTVPDDLIEAAVTRVSALFPGSNRPRVAVNLGSGRRWPKKMLGAAAIADFTERLRRIVDVDVMLVGDLSEAGKSAEVVALVDGDPRVQPALTPGSVPEFVAILRSAHALLCGDTLALHVASAIGLPTVAVFGPTSLAEIADFGGLINKIATPLLGCLGCYGDCTKQDNCMTLLDIDRLVAAVAAQLSRSSET